ncbi:MAG: MarR family winged helix-turn-helix transcriptional regulator [Acidimicrobiales bacterium]|jgi:DNA-binding MarR family transcriptional regulator
MSEEPGKRSRRAGSPSAVEVENACEDDDFDTHARWAAHAWPVIDEDVEAIVSRVEKAQRYLERAAVDTRDQVGLAHGELKILLHLTRGFRSQGALAKSLLVSTGTMTNQLDKLEASGLVARLPDPADRRGKLVEMTPKGRERLDNYINVQAARERELLGRLSRGEKRQLNDLMRKLLASLGEKPAGPPRTP